MEKSVKLKRCLVLPVETTSTPKSTCQVVAFGAQPRDDMSFDGWAPTILIAAFIKH